ncbi:MAG: DUF362 domain-containing protein [Deltaproteobacteria bacterium]|nr:DUF362 domain-containing protein [Deltaproteobacteria bacterium]MBT4267373.1 DUF362 domain-containing protein [Deltaproteobacteria bacterium]MBT4643502.1 DUF362 domain-containing protein [Deltaproteobacteria bacterium]MBT6499934.1 DUF362 domain-containing protein [Deltaproteobacteria bacterium]MBT6613569.1 DUF362 domain-containing protein [Deltaproteobacteria bacterium]
MTLSEVEFTSYEASVKSALDGIGARKHLSRQRAILIKPNLVNSSPHPVTTPMACCEAIIRYVKNCSTADIIIGEGCGDDELETDAVFEIHGYTDLARRYNVKLLDLNYVPLVKKSNSNCLVFREMMLPKIAFTHYIVSVPVLKAHSIATITGSLKNMMGFPPPKYYSGQFGFWKKAVFHQEMHLSIIDLNRYIKPDLTVMDATVGLADFHLGGAHCSPPLNRIIAGFDPLEIDRYGANLLGFDWRKISHLQG